MMGNRAKIFWITCAVSMMCGCDPLTTHKVTSTIFDGVPSMPSAEQYCRDYHEQKLAEELQASKKKQASETRSNYSTHPPYAEKRCEDCHDKTKESGLVRPRQQLCFLCHPDINKGAFVHGPAATGSCLECHEPHSSQNRSLLKADKGMICGTCHREKRLAESMHAKVAAKEMFCTDCHDPHAGNSHNFLK